MRIILGILISLGVFTIASGQSETIQRLMDEDRAGHCFYFYPSTLRMLNLKQDPEFNEMIKDLRKLIFFPIREDRFDDEMYYRAVDDLYAEDFEEYMTIDGSEGAVLHVVGKEKPFETVVLAKYQEGYYAADLVGSVDLLKLTRVYQKIAENDEVFSDSFLNVFDLMGGNKHRKHDRPGEEEKGNNQDGQRDVEGQEETTPEKSGQNEKSRS